MLSMKHRHENGFTFVEMLTVLALLAVLVGIAWGKFNKSYEKALRATMQSDLRNTATAQEIYYRLHETYAPDIDLVNIDPSPKSQIHITESNPMGWAAWNEIQRSDEKCELYVGHATPALGIALTSERIFCEKI
jgi:prepilin-type N-terminal cleavage/methylation domain-containing protein